MKLWKFNKRSSTLADMSMNRVLLTGLIAKGAVVGVVAGFCGASYRYLILESEHLRWQLMEGITLEWALGWLVAMVVFCLYRRSITDLGTVVRRFWYSSNRRGDARPL